MKVILTLVFSVAVLCQIQENKTIINETTTNADTYHTALLHGGVDLGYYYVNIYIGTPPKK